MTTEPAVTCVVLLTYGRDEECMAALDLQYMPPLWNPEDLLHQWEGVPASETAVGYWESDHQVDVPAAWLSRETGIPVEELPGRRLVWTRKGWRPAN